MDSRREAVDGLGEWNVPGGQTLEEVVADELLLEGDQQAVVRVLARAIVDALDGHEGLLEETQLLLLVLDVVKTKFGEFDLILGVVVTQQGRETAVCSVQAGASWRPEALDCVRHLITLGHCPQLVLEVQDNAENSLGFSKGDLLFEVGFGDLDLQECVLDLNFVSNGLNLLVNVDG